MAGLQGAGKTTTTAKLAKHLIEKRKKKVLTVSADVYRPAAIEQLKTVTRQAGAEWFPSEPNQKPHDIALAAIDHAKRHFFDVLLVDTAGRLAIDEALMAEIKDLHATLNPVETLFVVDAMQGQDAVNTAKAFKDALPLTGVILTKLDGDSRGGAALSVRQVTGAPIKFAGVSEKIDGLEVFDADRHAGRVLGMGDIVALVEQVTQSVDMASAQAMAEKLKSGSGFDLNDFLLQLQQMKKMGGLGGLLDKLPTNMMGNKQPGQADMDRAERDMRRMEGILNAMTAKERKQPALLMDGKSKASRKRRIATGAGVQIQDVNRLLNQFDQMQGMMKKMKGGGLMKMMKKFGGMKGMGGMMG
jgi:signal recognition particle subunit SRP54